MYYGLIVNLKKKIKRLDGTSLSFDKNKILILSLDNYRFLGTRVKTPFYKEFRLQLGKHDTFRKLISYSRLIV